MSTKGRTPSSTEEAAMSGESHGRPWSEVRRDMEAAGLARPRASYYPLSLLACGHWQPTEPVATLTASDLDSEDCRKCGLRVTRLYQWFPPKEDDDA